MNKQDRIEAARKLLLARDALLSARAKVVKAEEWYRETEEGYFRASAALPMDRPENLLIDTVLIMAREDFYDLKPGERLSFHKVEIA